MRRCIQLARNARLSASPNPMVGAVMVCEGRIIGEGYHVRCGESHAEVNAIASVEDKTLLKQSTLYVSLEPCSHYGKTPPCADLIIEKGIPRVVVGCIDPFASVSGRGVRKLQEAGVEVVVGVCEQECLELNKMFFTYHKHKRPYVTLKWAESLDGYIDYRRLKLTDGAPVRLSTDYTQQLVHKRRTEHQAILVGRRTALMDNPRLDTRCWQEKKPLRVVLDSFGALPPYLHVFDGSAPTLVYVCKGIKPSYAGRSGVECAYWDEPDQPVERIVEDLYARNVQSLLVEGGSLLLQGFVCSDCWDEAFVEQAPVNLGYGIPSPCPEDGTPMQIESWGSRFYKHYRRLQEDKG
ncbi:MAG: bifunctional diaminohydroxyphosphoribosylaminopyrimidine deaminase/5-amino-6-(5-phosphoribosylamino)uracil reductase RibD [Clostridium sp.]|nr:bifunctional diaminohydroxyphosphoribosylaminopyrimidine deaminase/5-amino-6-(5-phosphoribosylamino)uracil reductase RibD [Clostridium sp.]